MVLCGFILQLLLLQRSAHFTFTFTLRVINFTYCARFIFVNPISASINNVQGKTITLVAAFDVFGRVR